MSGWAYGLIAIWYVKLIVFLSSMKKALKTAAFGVIVVIMAVMAVATFVESGQGTQFVTEKIYGSWWFALLWGIAAIAGICYFFTSKKTLHDITLHCALLLILAGALATSLTSRVGTVHLRYGKPSSTLVLDSGDSIRLPFSIELKNFTIDYHNGTSMPSDYITEFTISDSTEMNVGGIVSMNNVFDYHGIRFFQTSFDSDMLGSTLTYNEDRIGKPLTYIGYYLLFLSLVWMLFAPSGGFRKLLHDSRLRKGLSVVALLAVVPDASAASTFSREVADAFGNMLIEKDGRVCPFETVAMDFTKKLYGGTEYKDYSAEQVLVGFLFFEKEWRGEPVIKVKNRELRNLEGLKKYSSLNDFFTDGYVLGPYVEEYYKGKRTGVNKAAAELDDRIAMIMSLRDGGWLKMFPIESEGRVVWYNPTDRLPSSTDSIQALFIRHAFNMIYETGVYCQDDKALIGLIGQMRKYQEKYGGASVPDGKKLKAEHIYNNVPFTGLLFKVNLTVGMVLMLLLVRSMIAGKRRCWEKMTDTAGVAVLSLSFAALSFCIALRWAISGRAPLGNGYETMLAVAWCVQLVTITAVWRFRYLLPFGMILSGFFLLVSSIGQMDPQITPLMPVLNSPLLSIHVSVIMMAYALLSFTFLCGVVALVIISVKRDENASEQIATLKLVSRLFLYPALALLGIGIFVGAIWADYSWGRYWGWDPKEVWALINFLLYAIALHDRSLPWLRRPVAYHAYMCIAFLTVLMTYIGANYFLVGMHSYA